MEPAATIIARLGGEQKVSEITGRAYTAPYRWQHAVEKGGTGGLIPQKLHRVLLDYAKSQGISLVAADFLSINPNTATANPNTATASLAACHSCGDSGASAGNSGESSPAEGGAL